MASPRSRPQVMSFEMSGSYSSGTVQPRYTPLSARRTCKALRSTSE